MVFNHRFLSAAVLAFSVTLCLSCNDDNDSSTSPVDGSHVDIEHIFWGKNYVVYSVRMDWSPDGSHIVYAGGPGGNIWRVKAESGAIPEPVTDIDSTDNEDGGYTPSYLANNLIAYYVGWMHNDQDMHIVTAVETQVKNVPAPAILNIFNGTHVGLGLYRSSSPSELSVSGDGLRAVGRWNEVYALDWSTGQVVSANITGAIGSGVGCVISRDGTKITYQTDGRIFWIPFEGGTPTTVGEGMYPSWNGDGTLLGYVDIGNKAYKTYNFTTGKTSSYAVSESQLLPFAALSWDGKSIAFRRFGTQETGISIGRLIE